MKKIINLLLAFILVFAFSCKTREKQVQKSETQTETKSEATARIKEKTLVYVTATMHYSFVATIGFFILLSINENGAKYDIKACVTFAKILNMKIKKIEDLNEKTEK